MFLRPGSLLFSAFYDFKCFKAQQDAYWGETPTRSLGCLFVLLLKKFIKRDKCSFLERCLVEKFLPRCFWSREWLWPGCKSTVENIMLYSNSAIYQQRTHEVQSNRVTTKKKKHDFSWNHTKEENHLEVLYPQRRDDHFPTKISELCNVDRHCGKCSRGNADWTLSNEKKEVWREAAVFLSSTARKNSRHHITVQHINLGVVSVVRLENLCSFSVI